MESLKELFDLGQANWSLLKDALAVLGGTGTVLASVMAILGLKNRWQDRQFERRAQRQKKREHDRLMAIQRSQWFAGLYHAKQDRWIIDAIDRMTIQQACGMMDWIIPEWAIDGWERVLVGDVNRRVKK